jgi:hypothetical protein
MEIGRPYSRLLYRLERSRPVVASRQTARRRATIDRHQRRRRFHEIAGWPDQRAPPTPRSMASLAQRTASITTPAEFGESQTSSFSSALSGIDPQSVDHVGLWP